ncbi:MAG: hypothetical protein AW08_03424 [Candidatus Accumulibacter adjunctus]|uniref:Uncharacterized protein n=1 Tax=Candidatus Accumulibacter adjunctus TaxID=1454001 RepID=A0A011NKM2_9PROT|nr:MAG: hypothetical protein AW08_03424 [Candidatus Accumulibacter adjunctus]
MDAARGHLVEGERAGLVRADHRRAAQRLHRRQPLDDGVALGHAVHAQRQGDRHHRRQSFGNGRHGERDGGHRGAQESVAARDAEDQDQRDDAAGDRSQPFAEPVELHLQGRRGLGGVGQHAGDPAHFGAHAGSGDDRLQAAVRHDGVHEDHAASLGQHRSRRDRIDVLRHRLRLAGECGLRHLGRMRVEHARIGRDAVAGFEQKDVARHEVDRGDLHHPSVTAHARDRCEHVLQRSQSRFGAVFLQETQRRVEDHDDGDDHGVLDIAQQGGQHGSAEQHEDEEIAELVEELPPRRARRPADEPVRTVAGEPGCRFCAAEASSRVYTQVAGRGRRGAGVPGYLFVGPGRRCRLRHAAWRGVGVRRKRRLPSLLHPSVLPVRSDARLGGMVWLPDSIDFNAQISSRRLRISACRSASMCSRAASTTRCVPCCSASV